MLVTYMLFMVWKKRMNISLFEMDIKRRLRGMQNIVAGASVICGIAAALLVFTDFFKTPPIPILLFGVLGIITGLASRKEAKSLSVIGMSISVASILYLCILFIRLGG